MSTDSQGRPLSDDGQWAWNGTEWVPATQAPPPGPATPQEPAGDPNATRIGANPFAGGAAPAGAGSPQGGQPAGGYGSAPGGYGSAPGGYGGAPGGYGSAPGGYGSMPGYDAAAGYGSPYGAPPGSAPKSRRPLVLGLIGGLVVVAAVVVVLILVLGGNDKKKLAGAYACSAAGQTGTLTVSSGNQYSLSDGGQGGTLTRDGDKVTFNGGSLDGTVANFDSSNDVLSFPFRNTTLTCRK